jgi:hypothetical protein
MKTLKMIKLMVVVLILMWPVISYGQQTRSFQQIDSLSYKSYVNGDWKKTLEYARIGFQSGVDYYYLRMRAGVSELNLHKPVQASTCFRKALEFNQNDPIALEYLYASLLSTGDLAEARLLASTYSPAFRKKLGIPARRLISSAFLESGYMANSQASKLKAFRPDVQLSEVYLLPDYWYLSAGVNLEAGRRFSASLSTNILSFKSIQQFLIQNQAPQILDVPFDQRAVYLSGSYYLGKGFHLSLAGQILAYTMPLYTWTNGTTGIQYIQNALVYTDFAFDGSVTKRFPYVTVELGADANRFKNVWYRQARAGLTLYPAGNVNTYLMAGATWIADSLASAGRFVVHAAAGRKLFGSVWIEGEFFYGDIRNFSEHNAYVVFNNLDLINKRMGASLLAYSVLPHLDLTLRYQYTRRLASWRTYQNSVYVEDVQQQYPVHSIIGGLTWRF